MNPTIRTFPPSTTSTRRTGGWLRSGGLRRQRRPGLQRRADRGRRGRHPGADVHGDGPGRPGGLARARSRWRWGSTPRSPASPRRPPTRSRRSGSRSSPTRRGETHELAKMYVAKGVETDLAREGGRQIHRDVDKAVIDPPARSSASTRTTWPRRRLRRRRRSSPSRSALWCRCCRPPPRRRQPAPGPADHAAGAVRLRCRGDLGDHPAWAYSGARQVLLRAPRRA